MEIHVFLRNSDGCEKNQNVSDESCTLHYGADWWIEDYTDGRSNSYKVLGQYQKDRYRILCVQKMPQNWIGNSYLGTDKVENLSRRVFQNILRIPGGIMEWESFANCV